MKLYSALVKKNHEGKISEVVLLKDGFSFWAFLFGPLWFLRHKMWREFATLLLASVAFSFFADRLFLELALSFVVALNANFWLVRSLQQKQYQLYGAVFGSNLANAKLRFVREFDNDQNSFDDAILNPKLHHKMMKLQNLKSRLFA